MTVLQRALSRDGCTIEERRLFEKIAEPQDKVSNNFWMCLIGGIFILNVSTLGLESKFGFAAFAVLYVMGVALLLGSSCFLKRPLDQVKEICCSTRWIPILIFFACLLMAFLAASVLNSPGVIFACTVTQSLAITWYSMSYMPHSRGCAKKTFIRFCGCFSDNAAPPAERY